MLRCKGGKSFQSVSMCEFDEETGMPRGNVTRELSPMEPGKSATVRDDLERVCEGLRPFGVLFYFFQNENIHLWRSTNMILK